MLNSATSRLTLFQGSEVFIDSNIFIYAGSKDHPLKPVCEDFLFDVKYGKITGFVNGRIVDEVFYRILLIEVSTKYALKAYEAPKFIKGNPKILKEIDVPRIVIEDILSFEGIKVVEIDRRVVNEAVKLSEVLLFSDAIHAATCKVCGIKDIATNDSDFRRVDFLRVWKPQ